jgi:mRNA interferase MazF
MAVYVPDAGDITWLQFGPQAGQEQAGRRPVVVLSPRAYNAKSGLLIACPVTTKINHYPFEVALDDDPASVVLADQVKCLDWKSRRPMLKNKASAVQLAEVRAKLRALIGL